MKCSCKTKKHSVAVLLCMSFFGPEYRFASGERLAEHMLVIDMCLSSPSCLYAVKTRGATKGLLCTNDLKML